jgi:hypothetical protein
VKLRPGDLITFSGLIGQDRGPCLVLAVVPFKGGTDLLVLTAHMRLQNLRFAHGSTLAQGIERVNDD